MKCSVVVLTCLTLCISLKAQLLDWQEMLVYVDSVVGDVKVNGEVVKQHQTFSANGFSFAVGYDGYATIVFSNGLAIYCGSDSEFVIESARQEEFVDVYSGDEYERRISEITLELITGTFGFVQPEPNPTSELAIKTRYGTIEGDASRFAVLLTPDENTALVLKGSLYFMPEDGRTRRFVGEDEVLNIRQASLNNSTDALTKLRARGRLRYSHIIDLAQRASSRTLFLATDIEPSFRTGILPNTLEGKAYNDYIMP